MVFVIIVDNGKHDDVCDDAHVLDKDKVIRFID